MTACPWFVNFEGNFAEFMWKHRRSCSILLAQEPFFIFLWSSNFASLFSIIWFVAIPQPCCTGCTFYFDLMKYPLVSWNVAGQSPHLVQCFSANTSLSWLVLVSSMFDHTRATFWETMIIRFQLMIVQKVMLSGGYHALVDSLETAHLPESYLARSVSWRAASTLRLEDFEAPVTDTLESTEGGLWGFESFGSAVVKLFEKAVSESTDPRPFQQLQNVLHLTEASSWRFKRSCCFGSEKIWSAWFFFNSFDNLKTIDDHWWPLIILILPRLGSIAPKCLLDTSAAFWNMLK